MVSPKVAVLIPAHNEEKTISQVVLGVLSFSTVFVVDDGSSDRTAERARAAGADVITVASNLGYDKAVWLGLRFIFDQGYSHAVVCDADGQHQAADVRSVMDALTIGRAEMVVGVRNRSARFSESIFSWHSARYHGILDPLCGLKGYSLNAKLFEDFSKYSTSVGTGLAMTGSRAGAKVSNVEISELPRLHGGSRFAGPFLANLKILRAFLWCLFQDFKQWFADRQRVRSGH